MKQKNEDLFFKVMKVLKEKNLTQTELAKKSGISQPSLSKILSGKYETKMVTAKKLAKVLGVPVTYLIDDNQKIFENSGIIGNNNSNNFNTDMKDIKIQIQDHEIRLLKLENELLRKELKK